MVLGRRRDIGAESSSFVSLAVARDKARELRKIGRDGGDPLAGRNRKVLTFREVAEEYHRIIAASFSSDKHWRLLLSGLKIHAYPMLADLPIQSTVVTDVSKVLEPKWTTKHETTRRIKQRLEAIFYWAKAEGRYKTENPCDGIKRALKPHRRKAIDHQLCRRSSCQCSTRNSQRGKVHQLGRCNSSSSQLADQEKCAKQGGVRWTKMFGPFQLCEPKFGNRIECRCRWKLFV